MRFSEKTVDVAAELPPPGEFIATIVGASEKPAPWAQEKDCLALLVEVTRGAEVWVFEDCTGLDAEKRLAVICRAAGIIPEGEVHPEVFVGRRVGVEVLRKVSSAGRERAGVGRWFAAPPLPVEKRPAVRSAPAAGRGADKAGQGAAGGLEDVPFAWLVPFVLFAFGGYLA